MKIELRPLSSITPYHGNPRINGQAVDAVATSIHEFGFRQPIVVDTEGIIICGHTRWKAAQKLGLDKVPVHTATDLSAAQIKAYRIADNQTASLSEWNYDLLPFELADLQACDFDLGLLGFDQEALAGLLDTGVQEGLCDPDDVPEPPDEAITQPGDLWILGDHRLLCGDSSKPEDLDRLLGGKSIHLANTDPPYNVKLEPRSNNAIAAGNSSFTNKHHQKFDLERHPEKAKGTHAKMRAKDRPLENDFVTEEEFDRLLDAWFGNIARVLLPGRGFYIWGGYANCANYPPFLKSHGLYFSQAIIWDKQHPVLTRKDFMGAHEWCQPPDTIVATPHGNVPISSLNDDDRVVSFDVASSSLTALECGRPIKTTSRYYEGELLCIQVADRKTWCTPEHLWTVRFAARDGTQHETVMSACCLSAGAMEIPVATSNYSVQWASLEAVRRIRYTGPVYSLEVENDHHYIADGIVTHNCFYGWKEDAAHKFYGPNNATDLWHVKKINPNAMVHLTEKPVELAVRAIQYSSRTGENVLDLFGGSGSTLIACEQTGRNGFLMELDPPYCDVIVQRYEQFSGRKAKREACDKTAKKAVAAGHETTAKAF